MIKNKKIIAVIMIISIILGTLTGCTPPEPKKPEVTKITVSKNPTKTEYFVGESFSAEGGEIKISYDDGTTETISMTADGVTVSDVKTTIGSDEEPFDDNVWRRWVNVTYEEQSGSFYVYVSYKLFTVTFDYGYNGLTESEIVRKDSAVEKPEDPVRGADWGFEGWFTAAKEEYAFTEPVTSDLTLFASWTSLLATSYTFVFDYNYYGVAPRTKSSPKIEEGNSATEPSAPTRVGHRFDGWFTAATGGSLYVFSSPVTKNIVVYAHWTKNTTGVSEWIFEAENTDLSLKSGPGLSGRASDTGMIITDAEFGASGGKFVSYLYEETYTTTLEFYIACSERVTDAKIVLRLSAESRSFTLTSSDYWVVVNGTALNYSPIEFRNVPPINYDKTDCLPFVDFVIATNVILSAGSNKIELVTNNTNPLAGTTILSYAPLVDCLKISTTGVVIWDGVSGLPKLR